MRIKPLFCLILLCALISCAPVPRYASAELKDAPSYAVDYLVDPLFGRKTPGIMIYMVIHKSDNADKITVQLPVWSPGDYSVQRHAQYVQDIGAYANNGNDNGPALDMVHPDANTWEINAKGVSTVVVHYILVDAPPGNFSENIHLTDTQFFANGPATFLYVAGRKETPIHVRFMKQSPVFIPLEPDKKDANSYTAPDYDTLADSPILMTSFLTTHDVATMRSFNVGGTTFRTIFFGDVKSINDPDAYTPVIQKLIQAETAIMGPMPTSHYDFFFDVNGRGGGLEHLNSCRIALSAFASPRRLAPFIAHEFFHLWNVKRIRPEVLGPFDYIQPPKTRNLWFAEGITEYYAQLATRRAGLYTDSELLSHFRNEIRRFSFTSARKRVTADEASLRVWETQGSQGYGGLSYYDKGELIGLCLDLKIRQVTDNRKSLDDMMRLLMQRHAPPKPGYKEDELRDTLSEVAGQDLSKFYDLLARSTDELPFEECLGYAGLDTRCQPLPTATDAQRAFLNHWLTGK